MNGIKSARLTSAAFIIFGAAVLAGCQQGAGTSTAGDLVQAGEQIRESDLRAYCPQPVLREDTAIKAVYERGGDNDPNRLIYQAVISDMTRNCQYSDGSATMHVVLAGRVTPGPKGRSGTVTLPIRIVAARGEQILYAQTFRHPVTISETAGATQFSFSDPNVTIPGGLDRGVNVSIRFDEDTKRR